VSAASAFAARESCTDAGPSRMSLAGQSRSTVVNLYLN
jgi:hypothetical protein